MLKDITIGQYFPGRSFLHQMDPRMKLVITLFFVVLLFVANNLLAVSLGIVMVAAGYATSKVPLRMVLKSIKPVLLIIVFTAMLNLFFVDGTPVFQWGFLKITQEGIRYAVLICVRILCLIAGTSLLTYTTSPISLTDGLEQLLAPLNKIHLPVHELAMMMTIALRFIPTLVEETDKIISAQKARGADMESGGLIQRSKALIPVLIPLFISAFRRADELAMAMECRCYRGGEGRTRMRQLHYSWRDYTVFGLFVAMTVAIILLNQLPMPI